MKSLFLISLILSLVSLSSLSAAPITSIEQLDSEALFSFSMQSDNKGYDSTHISSTDSRTAANGQRSARMEAWIAANSEFCLGVGDHLFKHRDRWNNVMLNDPFFHNHYYPIVADHENETKVNSHNGVTGDQSEWGRGYVLFESLNNFYSRPEVTFRPVQSAKVNSRGTLYDDQLVDYYAYRQHSGFTIHIIATHFGDSSVFAHRTKEWMMNKVYELGASKTDKDIIIVMAHAAGNFIRDVTHGDFTETGYTTISQGEIDDLVNTVDMICNASDHIYRRHHEWDHLYDGTQAILINTGALDTGAPQGYCDVHVFDNPPRFTVQYIDCDETTRKLHVGDNLADRVGMTSPYVKHVNGTFQIVDWNRFGPQPNDAEFFSQNVPSFMDPGETISVQVTMKNTGTESWSSASAQKLGSENPRDNSIWTGSSRVALTQTVAPDQNHTFTFDITAPMTPGQYDFQWQMVDDAGDNVGWYGFKTPNISISVGLNRIEAEDFVATNDSGGGQTESTTDIGGGLNVGWINAGDYFDYNVTVGSSEYYEVTFRIAVYGNASIDLIEGGSVLSSVTQASTGGYQNWTSTAPQTVFLSAGSHTLRVLAVSEGWNFNWFELKPIGANLPPHNPVDVKINFQPSSSEVPAGYIADSSQVYGDRGNGYTYGWESAFNETRERNAHADQRLDTINHTAGHHWEIALPVGEYVVSITGGDPSFPDSFIDFVAEQGTVNETSIVSGSVAGVNFVSGTETVTVLDGRLTISNGPSSVTPKICYIDIASVQQDPIGPAGYVYCADENGSFTLPNYSDVAYGANGQFNYLYAQSGTITFNNSTFGDPISGVFKHGFYKLLPIDNTAPNPDPMSFAVAPQPNTSDPLGILSAVTLSGNNPATGAPWVAGDTYRAVFVTSGTRDATSNTLADYNAFVQSLADSAGYGAVNWKVIGSSGGIDARDNTGSNPSVDGNGEAIYLVDGSTVVANNYADLWDGSLGAAINMDENKTADISVNPVTGSNYDGTGRERHLGGSDEATPKIEYGDSSKTGGQWILIFNGAETSQYHFYALSDPITIGDPAGDGETQIVMTATTATDASGVEYYFTETSGNAGGSDSGWQSSPTYIDTGLTPGTEYTYTVTARDLSAAQNTTSASAPASAITDIAVVLSDYEIWKTANNVSDDTSDDDGDGISNVMEFALGGNPKAVDGGQAPIASENGSNIEFKFHRAESSVTYTVEKSTDLVNWSDYATVTDVHGVVGSDCTVAVPVAEMGNGKLFLRLKVEN